MMTGIEYAISRGYEDTSSCHWIFDEDYVDIPKDIP